MSSTNSCNTINANADVLGRGVRIEFYFTMILLAIVPRTPYTEELLSALYAAAGFSGLGLLLTAIIQTALNQLSIFEGLFVFHVLFFLSAGAAPSGKYHWSKSRIAMGVFIQFALVAAYTGWGLYFWIHVKDFGTQPGCNLNDQVKYVIMFKDVPATAPWLRGLWITATVVSAVGLMVGFAFTALQLFTMRSEEEEEEEDRAEHASAIARNSTPTATPATQAHAETETPTSRNLWEVEIYYFKISIPLLLSSIYATTMLELMVHRNTAHVNKNGTVVGSGIVQIDESWQFGQILAVVMIIAILNEFVHFFFGYLARRRRDGRARARAEGQAQAVEAQAPPPQSNVTYRPRGPAGSSSSSRDSPIGKTSSEYELHNLDKGNNVEVSQTIVDPSSQLHDLPIGSLR